MSDAGGGGTELPPIVVQLLARTGAFRSEMGIAQKSISDFHDTSKSNLNAAAGVGKAALLGIAGAAITVGVTSIKMAGNYQESLTQLVTGAGESEDNIKRVGQGMLDMSSKVGMSAMDLSKGMYMIESAGYHGSQGLNVLKAAAEGARVGGADMASVADGLTTALTDYKIPASQAATVTSQLVATVAAGKTHMQDLSSSLATVLPAASAAGVGLNQILGAMATMTAKGTDARLAAMYLRGTILSMENPTQKQTDTMKAMGVSALDVSQHLGQRGLTGTFDILTAAISKHNVNGLVTIETLKKAAASHKTLQQATASMTETQKTAVATLADMMGGARNLQAALELTGASASTFKGNVAAIGATSTEAGGHVKGFGETQKDLNTKIANLKAGLSSMMIELGQKLIPIVESATAFFLQHKTVLIAVAGVIGAVLVGAMVAYLAKLAITVAQSIIGFAKMIAKVVEWVIANGAGLAETASLWAMYTAEWLAEQAAGAAEWLSFQAAMFAESLASAGTWVGEQLAGLATVVAGWLASAAEMAAAALAWAGEMLVAGAMALLPFLPIILAAAAVAAAGYLLVTHWKEIWGFIKSVAEDAWHFLDNNIIHPIEAAFKWVVDMIKQHWDLILAILTGPIGLAVDFIVNHFNDIVNFFSSVPGKIASIADGMWDPIWNAFKAAINFIIGGWDSLHFKLPSISLPFGMGSFGGMDIGVPQIPRLASGGIASVGGMVRVGEFGAENMFLPQGAQVHPLPANSGSGRGGGTITVEVPVYLDSQQIARVVTPPVRDNLIKLGRNMPDLFGGTA